MTSRPVPAGGNVCRRIGEQLGIHPETLRGWVKQAEIDAGTGFLRGGARPPQQVVLDYIEENKAEFGVEPICAALKDAGVPIAPSTFHAAMTRPPSARSLSDDENLKAIERVHRESYGVYGSRKIWAQLAREGGVGGTPASSSMAASQDCQRLGHADPGFTRRTYTHLLPDTESRTTDIIDAAFSRFGAPSTRQTSTHRSPSEAGTRGRSSGPTKIRRSPGDFGPQR